MKVFRLCSALRVAAFLSKKSVAGITLCFTALFFLPSLHAQTPLWAPVSYDNNLAQVNNCPDLPPFDMGTLLQLDVVAMQNKGKTAAKEFNHTPLTSAIVDLPLPDGSFQKFEIRESPLMEPQLAARYPEIQTYILKGIDDPLARGRMSVSPDEFGAFFSSPQLGQEVIIRKALKNSNAIYLSYWGKNDPSLQAPFTCLWEGAGRSPADENRAMLSGPNETGDVLRVFRLAMTIPGRLSENYGWTTTSQALSALVAFLGQLNTIFERDLSVRFVLPDAATNIIFLNSATDPFTALGGGEAANENITVINELIGQEGFDVGLIFVTGACCAAGKPTICGDYKAWNFSAFYSLRVTAHEIGHQFDADHTWTSCGPSNNGQFGTNEYGSGTSIMSYANICGIDNILPVGAGTYFGVYSQIQMTHHINARTCYKILETGNHIPTSSVPADGFYIPISTPFELVGQADDPDGDDLTFSWEQVNIRNIDFTASTISIQTPPTPADGNVPIARIFDPSTSPRRTIPQLSDLLSNTSTVYERLPTYSRNIKYRMYVRDNHPGAGGTTHQQVSFEVDGEAGPFLVTAPNTCVTWQAGSSYTVAWEVANTNNDKVNCQQVNIRLSLDGGYNYAYLLAAGTSNDGEESIQLPDGICSNQCRLKVEAADNIFFDISNADFNIISGATPIVKANALQLDGTDDQVEIQDATLGNFGTGDFTIEMWVQTTDDNCALMGKRAICNCDNFWNFFINAGRLQAEFSTSTSCNDYLNVAGSNNSLANGNWHHIAFVRQGTTLQYYVDGILDRTVFSNQNLDNAAKLRIGNIVCGGLNFRGSMDEIRIWSLARSVMELNEKMNCTLAGDEPGLLAYYPLSSQNCGACSAGTNTLIDNTANGYHGLLQNGAYTSLSTLDLTDCPNCANGNIAIADHPAGQSVSIGATATFTVAASGNNLSYQWYRSTDGGAVFTEIAGAVQPEYSLTVASAQQHASQYKCLISNGCDLIYSDPATLAISCPNLTLSSISGSVSPCADNYTTYFVSPDPNVVAWTWTTPAGWQATNFDNMIVVKPAAVAGTISVTGIDACGVVTATQTLEVAPQAVAITGQPASQSVVEGSAVEFVVEVSNGGGATSYLWQESNDGGNTYSSIIGANTAVYTIPSASLSQDGRKFRCIISNACLRDTTTIAALEVSCSSSAPATPAAISGGSLVCSNSTLAYSIAPVAGATSYEWTLPAGWIGNSNTPHITVTAGSTGGIMKVRAVNSCGMSGDQVLSIDMNANPCRRSVHFDGENDHLAVAQNGQTLNGDMSISCWVKPDVTAGEQTLIFNGREFIVGLSNDRIRYKHSDDCCGYDNTVDMIFSGNLQAGKWYHVAITRSAVNRSVSFYLNGNFIQTQTYAAHVAPPGDHTNDMILGAGKNGVWANFKGALDEIKIWEVIRSADEVKQDMVCHPAGDEPGLKAYYDFENGQPYGDNLTVSGFQSLASAYGPAAVRELALTGVASNVISGDLPSFIFQDLDGDGFGGENVDCNYTGPTVTNDLDCDDLNSAVYPFAPEICNGIDDDCSGIADDLPNPVAAENLPIPIPAGQTITSTLTVSSPVTIITDLNVINLHVSHIWIGDLTIRLKSPQGTEITLLQTVCGDQDDLLINFDDEAPAAYGAFPCPPTDNGNYQPLSPLSAFDGENPNGTWTLTVADEYEDAGILNAWGIVFPTLPSTFFTDQDGDGFGNAANSTQACFAPDGYVSNAIDCNDGDGQVFPGATEICNELDDDCDGLVDEDAGTIWFADQDGDGFGDPVSSILSCVPPAAFVANSDDCDDNNSAIYPDADEIINGLDDDCNGIVDDTTGTSAVWQLPNKNIFALLPNPADDNLKVVFASNEKTSGSVVVFNQVGQDLLRENIVAEGGKEIVLRIGHLPQGAYFLVFIQDDGTTAGARFIIARSGG
ncbi:MAG: LamG-like jellyroll fold domain-containing protein [Saprospiraceae bacterium]|nr:LamG-like jellyroll fold domain-containing protein [Saprospiraceae bacterium]